MWPIPQFPAYLVIFTEEILNGKLFLCSVHSVNHSMYSIAVQRLLKSLKRSEKYERFVVIEDHVIFLDILQ